jgi:hypothetical protein
MSHLLLVMAMAAAMPTTDLARICEPARSAALPEDRAGAYDSCVRDEQAARDKLRQKWGQFSAAARNDCAQTAGVVQSYVELLTCLEMQNGGNFGPDGTRQPTISSSPPVQPAAPDAAATKP